MVNVNDLNRRPPKAPWTQWALSMLLGALLPLLPLLLDHWSLGHVELRTLLITSSLFLFAIATAFRNVFMLLSLISVSLVLSIFYGSVTRGTAPNDGKWQWAGMSEDSVRLLAIGAIVIGGVLYGFQRYKRHVLNGERYLDVSSD